MIAAVWATSAFAISGADLFVDLDQHAGKEVTLEQVHVFSASNNSALGTSSGITFRIEWRGADREAMRWILKNCNGIGNDGCDLRSMTVTPTGEKGWVGPILINLKDIRQ